MKTYTNLWKIASSEENRNTGGRRWEVYFSSLPLGCVWRKNKHLHIFTTQKKNKTPSQKSFYGFPPLWERKSLIWSINSAWYGPADLSCLISSLSSFGSLQFSRARLFWASSFTQAFLPASRILTLTSEPFPFFASKLQVSEDTASTNNTF